MNCEEIGYSSPNSGAIELMGEEYDSYIQNPADEDIARCEFYHDIPANVLTDTYEPLWTDVQNAH